MNQCRTLQYPYPSDFCDRDTEVFVGYSFKYLELTSSYKICKIRMTRKQRFELHESTYKFFSINTYSTINASSLPYDFLNNIFFSLTHFIVIQHVMHLIYKMHVNQLFMWSVRFPVNSGLLVAKFGGSQSYMQNFYCEGSVPLTSSSFKGQLYILCKLPYTPSATPFKALSVT